MYALHDDLPDSLKVYPFLTPSVLDPYITVKTRLQAKGKYSGTLDVLQKIYTQEGIGSFFKGTHRPFLSFPQRSCRAVRLTTHTHHRILAAAPVGIESKIVQSVLTAAFLFMVQNKLANSFLKLLVYIYIRRLPQQQQQLRK
jgi:hypothetical protein